MKKILKNGAVKWPLLTIGIITLLFGSNILGPAVREHFIGQTKQEAMAGDIDKIRDSIKKNESILEDHRKSIAEHDKSIAVIREQLDRIDERTRQTQELVKQIQQLIIQDRSTP